jgi:hypothetical protein
VGPSCATTRTTAASIASPPSATTIQAGRTPP